MKELKDNLEIKRTNFIEESEKLRLKIETIVSLSKNKNFEKLGFIAKVKIRIFGRNMM